MTGQELRESIERGKTSAVAESKLLKKALMENGGADVCVTMNKEACRLAETVLTEAYLRFLEIDVREAVQNHSRALVIGVRSSADLKPQISGNGSKLEGAVFRLLQEAGYAPKLWRRKPNGSYGEFGKDEICESTLVNAIYDLISDISGDKYYERSDDWAIVLPLDVAFPKDSRRGRCKKQGQGSGIA